MTIRSPRKTRSKYAGEFPANHRPDWEDADCTQLLINILMAELAFVPGVGEATDATLMFLEAGGGLASSAAASASARAAMAAAAAKGVDEESALSASRAITRDDLNADQQANLKRYMK
jgi:hypothetical protein